jgi:hypothetical protein
MSSLVVTLLFNNTCNNNFKAHHQTLDMKGFWPVEFLLLNNY